VSEHRETKLADVMRITKPGLSEARPRVLAEFQGAILYTIAEEFQPGRLDYPFPHMDMYEYTPSRLIGLDIDIDFSVSEQVTGDFKSFYRRTDKAVGVELWKSLSHVDHGCEEANAWAFARYHHSFITLGEPGHLTADAVSAPETNMVYALGYVTEDEYTPKMRGTNDE
jgi:hypothetical protein